MHLHEYSSLTVGVCDSSFIRLCAFIVKVYTINFNSLIILLVFAIMCFSFRSSATVVRYLYQRYITIVLHTCL